MKLRVLSYNIHKGFSGGLSRYTLHQMRDALRELRPDLLFLQEIHGEHHGHRRRIQMAPPGSQFEYLAGEIWPHFSYGKNMVYSQGHHGNAILSKFPILSSENIDVSQNRFERRGILHAVIDLSSAISGQTTPIHAFCAHLGLLGWHRTKQLEKLATSLGSVAPSDARVIAAGDFNDWGKLASAALERRLSLKEAFTVTCGKHAKSFPSWFPVLCLDRVYYRGFQARQAKTLDDPSWALLSDHLALWVELEVASSQ